MSVRVMAAVWRLVLHPTDKLVLLAIADNANDEGRHAYASEQHLGPGRDTEPGKTGLSVRAIREAIGHLEHHGWLAVDRQGSEAGTNLYTVRVEGGTTCRLGRTTCIRGVNPKVSEPPEADPGGEERRAAPGGNDVPGGEAPGAALGGNDVPPNHQKEPSENQPTASPPDAGRRLRLAASNDGPVTTQHLIAEHVEQLGYRPATIGHLSATVKRLLEREHKPPAIVRTALDLMRTKQLTSPTVLPALVDEVLAAQTRRPATPPPAPAELAERPLPGAPREEWEAWGRKHHPELFKDGATS